MSDQAQKAYAPPGAFAAQLSSFAGQSHGSLKGPGPAWMSPYALPGFIYRVMLGTQLEKEYALRAVPEDVLDQAIEYATTKDLRRTFLKAKRDKIWNGRERFQSIIVNEIVGIYDAIKITKRYCKATIRMYLDA